MNNELLNFNILKPQPLMVVISGPSGVGKDAVVKELQHRKFPIQFVVTTNSRKPRPYEVEGVDYFFISREQFEQMIAKDEFIEYAHVYDDYKGVSRAQVRKALESGSDVILRLDVQGAARIRKINPDAVLIFLAPTDETEWLNRIKKRGTETSESLKIRVDTACRELEYLPIFDYVITNSEGHLADTVDTLEQIIKIEHLKVHPRKINL